MRLELDRWADYAIPAAVDLARHDPGAQRRKAKAIAEEMDIPVSYVQTTLAELVDIDAALDAGTYQPPATLTPTVTR